MDQESLREVEQLCKELTRHEVPAHIVDSILGYALKATGGVFKYRRCITYERTGPGPWEPVTEGEVLAECGRVGLAIAKSGGEAESRCGTAIYTILDAEEDGLADGSGRRGGDGAVPGLQELENAKALLRKGLG